MCLNPIAMKIIIPEIPAIMQRSIPPVVSHAVMHELILTFVVLIWKKFDGIHMAML